MQADILKLTIKQASQKLKKGEFSARELTKAYLKNIEAKNSKVNAYIEVFDDALAQADMADKLLQQNRKKTGNTPANNLLGIPLAIKDNILIKDKTVTAGSKILQNYTASYDAGVIKKLKSRGAVFLGRTNMDEFAMGSSTEHSVYGATRNSHDPTRVPGGSSGGSAVAVANETALAALGSDTGGSVRQPASFCGVVGLKPTYGALSRSGLIAMGSSLDVIGPLTKTVGDAEIIFNSIKGHDALDSTSLPDKLHKKQDVSGVQDKEKLTIGVPRSFLESGIDTAVMQVFDRAINKLKSLGFEIKDVELPHIKYSLPVYYIIMPAEVSTNLERFDGVKYGYHAEGKDLLDDYIKTRTTGFGDEAIRRILLGTYVLSAGYYDAYYNKALAIRQLITNDFNQIFTEDTRADNSADNRVHAMITPTAPTTAFKANTKTDDPVKMYLADIFTVTANITGLPAISVPAGYEQISGGIELPIGIQFMGSHLGEQTLFDICKKFNDEI